MVAGTGDDSFSYSGRITADHPFKTDVFFSEPAKSSTK